MKKKTTLLAKVFLMLLATLFSFTGARADELTVYEGTETSNQVPAYIFYFDDFTRCQYVIPAEDLTDIPAGSTITSLKYYTTNGNVPYTTVSTVDVYLMEVGYTTMTGLEPKANGTIVYQGILDVVAEGEEGSLTINFSTPYTYEGGNLLVGIDNTTDSGYKSINFYGQVVAGAAWSGSNTGSSDGVTGVVRNFLPKTTIGFTPGSGNILKRPTGLKVSYEGGTEATVSWASEDDLFDIDVNGTVTEDVENPYTLTGLEYLTTYTIKVRAKRDGKVSSWSSPVSFTTEFNGSTCQIQLVLNDSYGDGWSGNAIVVSDVLSGTVFGNYTLTSGDTETFIIEVPDERDIQFSWVAGSWSDECSYAAYDVNEVEIFSGSGALSAPVTYTVNCTIYPWRTPTDLAALAGPTSAELSWTENSLTPATSWVIAYMAEGDEDLSYALAESNPFTLEGLTPETTYAVKVRPATDEVEFWSDEITFTTLVAFPAPTDLAASDITSNSATITWGGAADSYNLRYRVAKGFNYDFESAEAFAVDAFSPCTTYDGDELSTYGIQNYDMPNANYVGSVIAFSDNDQWAAHSGNTMGAFIDAIPGSEATENDDYFITPELTIASGDHFSFWARSVTASYGLERIKVGVYGGNGTFSSYLAGSATTYVEVPVEWTQYDYDLTDYAGQTIQLAINCVSADAFALLFDDLFVGDPTDDTWDVTLTDVTSPYVLNGLSNETKYEVEVQAVYTGEDSGESVWVGTDFRTLTSNPVPYDIEADLAADGATFTWTGEGDSYNVQYRTAESRDTYYFNDFNNQDTEGWTRDYFIYGFTDPIYDVAGDDNYFLELGWNSTDEEIIISSELPEYESGAHVEFYYFGYSTANTFQVGFSTTTNDADAFTWSSPIEAPLQTYTLYNEELADGVKYVAFKATASEQGASIFIDDFGIFSPTIPASEWQTIVAEEATATISGLATNALYEYQIQSVKGENESNWTNVGEFALVTLDCDGDNEDLIAKFDGKFAHVTLANRTFYKDGTWNSIYLPFDLTEEEFNKTVLADGELRTLTSISAEDERIKLNFDEAMGMYASHGYPDFIAGFPYIIKWATGSNVVNPEFAGVTISAAQYGTSAKNEDESIEISFGGTYDAYEFDAEEPSVLFIGENSKLYYPQAGAKIGATRGFFILNGVTAGESNGVKFYTNLDGDDATGIANISVKESGEWYDLSGRKLAGKPMQKGIYVNGGRKVTIK